MMNIWHNRTSQYPMLPWRAWKITIAKRWFMSWETKSDGFNLKLCSIQVESTKAQPVKTTANLLLSEGYISVQSEGVMCVKFLCTEREMGGCHSNGSKASHKTGPWESHHNKLQWPRDCSPWEPATCPSFMPLLGGGVVPQHPSLPTTRAWILCPVHIICVRRKGSQRILWGHATSVCLVQEKTLAKGSSSYYWERKMHPSNSFAFHLELTLTPLSCLPSNPS